MNEQDVIKGMISFIESKERQLQSNKTATDPQAKNDVVKSILDELDRVTSNENQ